MISITIMIIFQGCVRESWSLRRSWLELNVLLGFLLGTHQVNLINIMINIIILTIPIIIINWHIPRLPYDPELGRKLLSPPELLKRQPVSKHKIKATFSQVTSALCSSCLWWGCQESSLTRRRRRWRRWEPGWWPRWWARPEILTPVLTNHVY